MHSRCTEQDDAMKEALGREIRLQRQKRVWTIGHLAAASSVGEATLKRYEAGSAGFKLDELARIARALDMGLWVSFVEGDVEARAQRLSAAFEAATPKEQRIVELTLDLAASESWEGSRFAQGVAASVPSSVRLAQEIATDHPDLEAGLVAYCRAVLQAKALRSDGDDNGET